MHMRNFRSSRTDFADEWVCMHCSSSLLVDNMRDHMFQLRAFLPSLAPKLGASKESLIYAMNEDKIPPTGLPASDASN
jgi:hypothetical protein